ncbi:hypothetical protein M2165_001671 [Variovorax sp. TBS-050B]|uniref:hypothetical protein n=1 Tax=Variovorax sp. TBS-050B TaxID=2940551 RepID=UPI002475AFAA|nr:hypothetical protein [Variovorax sp. TBS-050B]MDH6591782.1 hypothetical protein [Variovorax sp. TBS-050B]
MAAHPSSFSPSSSSASPERAWRLPRHFAWIAVAVDALLFVAGMAVQLLPASPHGEQMRGVYAQPGVWIPMLSRVATVWLLAATLAWCHARHALERRGAARIAQLRAPGLRFGAVYLAVMLLNVVVLSPLLYQVQLLFMPGGSLYGSFDMHGMQSVLALSRLMHAVVQAIVIVAGVWLAAWFALRERGLSSPATEAPDHAAGSTRSAVALVVAAMFAALQMWLGNVLSGWVDTSRDTDLLPLLLAWVGAPLLVVALAFWGGWLGAAPGPAQVRPFRAVGATVSAFVLLQVACVALAAGGLLWIASASQMGRSSDSRLLMLGLAMVAIYLVLLVVLVRTVVRAFYRRLYL